MAGASLTNGVGSVEQFHGHEADLALADVLEVMDQRLVRRVLGVVRVTDVVLAGDHRPVGGALAAGAAVHHRPEVPAGMRMERATLAGLQPDLPDPDVVVFEPQPGTDIEVARRGVELGGVLVAVERAFAEDGGCHGGLPWSAGCGQCPGSCKPKMSRGSPGRNVPVNCELSPISRVRASNCRPTSSCRRSHAASAVGTSPPAVDSSSARAQPSSAALAVAAAACGRTANAASPTRQTRPRAMRGTSMSYTAWTNGSATLATTSAIGAARTCSAARRTPATASSVAAPGGSDTARRTPSRPVMS